LACFVTVVVALCVLASWLPGGRQRTRPLPERAWKEYCAELAELTALQLAGGIGIEEALRGSLILAGSPAAGRVREAFEAAGPVPRPAAEVLERVALTEGVGPLASLASCLQMSVSSGAPVATTLLARADSLRTEVLAEQQARAARMAERLFLPGILLMLGFMTLVGYPAVALISKGFS
jgi:tight adherence protein C